MPCVRTVRTDAEFQRCLHIRRAVFIEEQRVPESLEIDALEPVCTHFLAWSGADDVLDDALGTARLLITDAGRAKIQRVAVLAKARRTGIGRALMAAIEAAAKQAGHQQTILGAQLSAMPFYVRLGYVAYGPTFDDAGIPHRMMRKAL